MIAENFQQIIRLYPAFDRRDPDGSKDFGVHGVDLVMTLVGPRGAIEFVVCTNWHLPAVQTNFDARAIANGWLGGHKPVPADLRYHSICPQSVGQTSYECELVRGGTCYLDWSGLQANEVFDLLVSGGDEAVWKTLRERHDALVI